MQKKIMIPVSIAVSVTIIGGIWYLNRPTSTTKAQSETLTVYAAGPKGLSDKLVKNFTKQTGIKVKTFDGTTGKILSKVQAEGKKPQADVLILASMASGIDLQKKHKLVSYKPKNEKLINPDFHDNNHELFNYSASAVGIAYSKLAVKSAPKDWSDLTKKQYQNSLTIPDPKTSGSSLDFINAYQMKHSGKLFKGLKNNGAEVGGANKETLDAVITGQKKAVVGAVDYMSLTAIKKGERIGFVYPSSGTLVNPRPAMILKTSQHQDAAKQFISYLLSTKAQTIVSKAHLIAGTSKQITNPITKQKINMYHIDWPQAKNKLTANLANFTLVFAHA